MINFISKPGNQEPKKGKEAYTLTDIYNWFKLRDLAFVEEKKLTAKQYREICELANSLIIEDLFLRGYTLKLPYALGTMELISKKTDTKNRKLDYKASKEHKMAVYHDNKHSWGRHYRLYWKKFKTTNIGYFRFTLSRYNKRLLASLIKTGKVNSNGSPW